MDLTVARPSSISCQRHAQGEIEAQRGGGFGLGRQFSQLRLDERALLNDDIDKPCIADISAHGGGHLEANRVLQSLAALRCACMTLDDASRMLPCSRFENGSGIEIAVLHLMR